MVRRPSFGSEIGQARRTKQTKTVKVMQRSLYGHNQTKFCQVSTTAGHKSSGMSTNWVTRKHPPTHLIERYLFRISQVSQSVTWPNFLRVVCLGPADRLDSPSCTSPKVYTDSRISLCIISNGLIRRWPFDELKPLQLAESLPRNKSNSGDGVGFPRRPGRNNP